MRKLILISVAVVLASCGSINVAYDYDEEANFDRYRTYNYMPDMDSGLSQLDLDRLTRATDSILTDKGFRKADNPRLLINIFSGQYRQRSGTSIGVGMGSGGRGGGVSIGGGIPIGGQEVHQTITFDVIDTQKDMLIWQAVSDSNRKRSTTPQARVSYFTKIALKVFSDFPPEG